MGAGASFNRRHGWIVRSQSLRYSYSKLKNSRPDGRSGSDLVTADASLALGSSGLRFVDPDTEKQFRRWRAVELLPNFRVVCVANLVAVGAVPIVSWQLFGIDWSKDFLWPIIYGVLCPVFALLAWPRSSITNRILPVARYPLTAFCVVIAMTGLFGTQWMIIHSFRDIPAAATFAIVVSLWLPYMRVPALPSALVFGSYGAPTTVAAVYAYQQGEMTISAIGLIVNSMAAAAFIISVTAVALDREMRSRYVNLRTVERQRKQLTDNQQLISRYVPAAVSRHIVDGRLAEITEPQRRLVTVLFADIAGFTAMADQVAPDITTEVLSQHLSAMAAIIEAHGGTLNEFAGDGLMALFGAPDLMSPRQQVTNAIMAAQDMQARMPQLNKVWRGLGLGTDLAIRIGINTGFASVGSYGSEGRMTYTAIGIQTNIASRIEGFAQPGQILIAEACYQLIKGQIACRAVGQVNCKGVRKPVSVHEPVGAARGQDTANPQKIS